jgi:hypothetical protein
VEEDLRRCSRAFKAGAFSARELVDAVGGPAALLRALGWWNDAGYPSIPFDLDEQYDHSPPMSFPVRINLLPWGVLGVEQRGPDGEYPYLVSIDLVEGQVVSTTFDQDGQQYTRTAVWPHPQHLPL